jgi:hypothetical protein
MSSPWQQLRKPRTWRAWAQRWSCPATRIW